MQYFCIIKWTTPGPWAESKPAGQNSGDQPYLKETATDCTLLVVSNRLLRARLGHHLTLLGGIQKEETVVNTGFY